MHHSNVVNGDLWLHLTDLRFGAQIKEGAVDHPLVHVFKFLSEAEKRQLPTVLEARTVPLKELILVQLCKVGELTVRCLESVDDGYLSNQANHVLS